MMKNRAGKKFIGLILVATLMISCSFFSETLEEQNRGRTDVDRGYESGTSCHQIQTKFNECRFGLFWKDDPDTQDCTEEQFEAEADQCRLQCLLDAQCSQIGKELCTSMANTLAGCLHACLPYFSCDEENLIDPGQICDGTADCADGTDETVGCVPFLGFLECDDPDSYERHYRDDDDDD